MSTPGKTAQITQNSETIREKRYEISSLSSRARAAILAADRKGFLSLRFTTASSTIQGIASASRLPY
jgi:hypothetical protein